MTRTKSSRALLSVVLAVLMAAAFMPSLTYSSFAATAKKATKVTKASHADKSSFTRTVGTAWTLKYKLSPSKLTSSAKKVVWKSSNSKVAKITTIKSGKAVVSFKSAGSATVTVYTKANKKAKTSWKFKVVNKTTKKTTTLTGVTVSAPNVKDAVADKVAVGTTLKANVAPEDAAGVTYQWYADGTPIDGATKASFTVTTDQIGKAITVKAKSKNEVESAATAKVSGITLKNADIKTVNDDAATAKTTPYKTDKSFNVGETEAVVLTDDSNNTLDSSVATYQWYRSGTVNSATVDTAISGATSSTYKLTSADKGYTVYCIVTPKANVTVNAATQYDGKTIKVNGGAVVSQITGVTIKDGSKEVKIALTGTALTASVTPAAAADDVTYQWYSVKNGKATAISGATSATYTPTVEGTYQVQISVKSGSVWTFANANAYSANVTVSAKGTKTASITRAWNSTAAATQDSATPRTDNEVGDKLKVTVPSDLEGNATIQWFVDGVKDANGNDVALGEATDITSETTNEISYDIPATYTDKDKKAQSMVGQKIYAVVTGTTGDYAGTSAKTDSFAVSQKKVTGTSVAVTNPTKGLTLTTNKTAVTLTGTKAENAATTLTFTAPSGYEIAKIVTDNSAASVNDSTVTVTGTPNFNVTVYFCKSEDTTKNTDAYAPVNYTVNMSGVKVLSATN